MADIERENRKQELRRRVVDTKDLLQQQEPEQPQYDGHNQQNRQQQEPQSHPQQSKAEQDSFLGQLRLGLYQLDTI